MTDPLAAPSGILESLLDGAKAKQQQEAEARQIAEERERRLRDLAAQRERLAIAFDHAFQFPNEEIEAGRVPSPDAFRRWAERFVELAVILRESDRAVEGLCLEERFRAVAGKSLPAEVKYAVALLLRASDGDAEAVAIALEGANGDEELRRFVLWLPYILDHMWQPYPNKHELFLTMAMPPEGTSREDYEQVEQAFGWAELRLPADPAPLPQQPCGPLPHGIWPLVGERTGRRDPLPELARDTNRERQSRYCQGFDPDWWLPALVAAKWRSSLYPREATRESVEQWLELLDNWRIECLGPFGMPEREAELAANREHDLHLIQDHAPQLYDAVMLKALDQSASLRSFIAERVRTSDNPPPKHEVRSKLVTTVAPDTIISLGSRVYRINERDRVVTENEDNVLQSFLGDSTRPPVFRLPEPDLIDRSGVNEPAKILRSLQKKYDGLFEPALCPPPKKGEGWGVRIVRNAE